MLDLFKTKRNSIESFVTGFNKLAKRLEKYAVNDEGKLDLRDPFASRRSKDIELLNAFIASNYEDNNIKFTLMDRFTRELKLFKLYSKGLETLRKELLKLARFSKSDLDNDSIQFLKRFDNLFRAIQEYVIVLKMNREYICLRTFDYIKVDDHFKAEVIKIVKTLENENNLGDPMSPLVAAIKILTGEKSSKHNEIDHYLNDTSTLLGKIGVFLHNNVGNRIMEYDAGRDRSLAMPSPQAMTAAMALCIPDLVIRPFFIILSRNSLPIANTILDQIGLNRASALKVLEGEGIKIN